MITERDLLILEKKIDNFSRKYDILDYKNPISVSIDYAVIGALNMYLYYRKHHYSFSDKFLGKVFEEDIMKLTYINVVDYLKNIGANDILKKIDDIEDALKVCIVILNYYVAQDIRFLNFKDPIVKRYINTIRKHQKFMGRLNNA